MGATEALASLDLSDGALAFGAGGGVTLDGTPFIANGPILLLGNGGGASTIDTTGNGAVPGESIELAGPIDGNGAGTQALTLNAGHAGITLGGSVGATTPVGALTFTDATLSLGANVGISTAGGAVTQNGVTRLLEGTGTGLNSTVTINTNAGGATAGAAITFTAAIDAGKSGGPALVLNAGSGGTVTLAANAGAGTPLGGLAITGGVIQLGGLLYQTNAGAITMHGAATFAQPAVTIETVLPVSLLTSLTSTATTGADITLSDVEGANTTLTLDPGIAAVSIGAGTLSEIEIIEGTNSSISGLVVNDTSLGGSGVGVGMRVAGFTGSDAASRAFIRPGGNWTVDGGAVLITDPALAGLSNEVLNNEGIGPAIALMIQIQQLIDRGDTGETAAQQAFDQFPTRSNYAVDPFHQRYNILGVSQQEGVGGFEDISYVQDGFWEGLLKK